MQGQIAITSGPMTPSYTVIAWDYGCDTFTFVWAGNIVPDAPHIAGIDFVFVQKGSFLIEKAYSEFNNLLLMGEQGCKLVGGACGTSQCGACEA